MKSLLVLCVLFAPLGADEETTTPEPVQEARVSYEGSQLLKVSAATEEKKQALQKLLDIEGKQICPYGVSGHYFCRGDWGGREQGDDEQQRIHGATCPLPHAHL
jgi:hypothetical protein